ncbi:MAG: Holliday junction resolvase RuvX [Alphaproteobacteria bacterium]|nr:Holliday junction resolvase RuvX [Alphaproteobacteria bacterium]
MNKLQAKTFLGIDYGTKRIGLALGNIAEKAARPFKIIHQLKELEDIIPAKNVDAFVVGWPLQPDGTEGETCRQVKLFCERLIEKFGIPVFYVDERLSSKKSEEYLRDSLFMRPDKRKDILDAESARVILQQFLDNY